MADVYQPNRTTGVPQLPQLPGSSTAGAGGAFSSNLASPYTPNVPGSGFGGPANAPISAYGTQAGGPPPGMKNPTWNPVYGVWMESDPGIDKNSPESIASMNAMDSYGASFGASQASGGNTWGYGGAQTQSPPSTYQNSLSNPPQNSVPPPPTSAGTPTTSPATPPLSDTQGTMQPQQPGTGVPPQLAQMGITPDMWQYLLQMWSNQGLGPNYSTGGN